MKVYSPNCGQETYLIGNYPKFPRKGRRFLTISGSQSEFLGMAAKMDICTDTDKVWVTVPGVIMSLSFYIKQKLLGLNILLTQVKIFPHRYVMVLKSRYMIKIPKSRVNIIQ